MARCWWSGVKEECKPPPRSRPPASRVKGMHWEWTGKHRRGADGVLVCHYTTRARLADKGRVEEQGPPPLGCCPTCGRGIYSVADEPTWEHYTRWRARTRKTTARTHGFVPWFEEGTRPQRGRKWQAHPWTWQHRVTRNGSVECRYRTRLKKWKWGPQACRECGRQLVGIQQGR